MAQSVEPTLNTTAYPSGSARARPRNLHPAARKPESYVTPATPSPARTSSAPPAARERPSRSTPQASAPAPPPTGHNVPWFPLALALTLAGFVFVPPVRDNPRLVWTFLGVSGLLTLWSLLLTVIARRRARVFALQFNPVASHYVQAFVQFCIMLYWGWYAREVYAYLPLVLAQVVFLYAFEGLVTWSRSGVGGRPWKLGFGPLPIIFSTNLLLWFKEDWFFFQFLMIALGALGKQFVTWNREGRGGRTHIFNPSAFGQTLIAIALIATGTTSDLTWGERIAATFDPQYMLVVIFLAGVVVQSLFHVTLMTLGAASVLLLLNLAYTESTGVYYFINTNLAPPIFLGIHLLVTDPATSPRTNLGRVVFGGLYAAAYFALFHILDDANIPTFWDKLLPVTVLNLCVPLIDRLARTGLPGMANRLWESALAPARLNLVHMGCWIALFATLLATGYIEAPHPGNSIPFWKEAVADGKPRAARSLIIAAGVQADSGAPEAWNELGVIWADGLPGIKPNAARAAGYFARACELGGIHGCSNVADQFLFLGAARSAADVDRALGTLEQECGRHPDSNICFRAGYAYETGRGAARPQNYARAIELYERCGPNNLFGAKGLARVALTSGAPQYDLSSTAPVLLHASASDPEACWYLAYMHLAGNGLPRDPSKARDFLARACTLGSKKACEALNQPELPPFSRPELLIPPWSTAFPMPPR